MKFAFCVRMKHYPQSHLVLKPLPNGGIRNLVVFCPRSQSSISPQNCHSPLIGVGNKWYQFDSKYQGRHSLSKFSRG